jgi:hypothetical protein
MIMFQFHLFHHDLSFIIGHGYLMQCCLNEDWFLKDRYGEPERGSEWEPIKILLEGDENSNKTNTDSNTRLWLTTQIGQAHVATGVLLNLGTNFQPHIPENAVEHEPRVHWPTPVRPVPAGETWRLSQKGFTPVRPVKHTGQTGLSQKAPKSTNRPTDLQTDPNSKLLNTGQ